MDYFIANLVSKNDTITAKNLEESAKKLGSVILKKILEVQERAKCGYCGSYVKKDALMCKKCQRSFESEDQHQLSTPPFFN